MNDNGVIGLEFIVDFGAPHGSQREIRPFGGPCNNFGEATLTAAGSVTYLADGVDLTFLRSLLQGSQALPAFKVFSTRFLGPGFTGVSIT